MVVMSSMVPEAVFIGEGPHGEERGVEGEDPWMVEEEDSP